MATHRWAFWEYAAFNWGLHANKSCSSRAEIPLKEFAFSQHLLGTWASYVVFSRLRDVETTRNSTLEWIKLASFVNEGASPLHIATIYGLRGLAQECLARGLNGNMRDATGTTPFMLAAANNRDDMLRMMLATKSLDINILDENGHSALYHAGRFSHVDVFRFLLGCPAINPSAGRVLECIGPYNYSAEVCEVVRMLLARPDFDLYTQPHQSSVDALSAVVRGFCAGDLEVAQALVSRPGFHARKASYEETTMNDNLAYMSNTDYDACFVGEESMKGQCNIPAMILLEKTFPHVSDLWAMRLVWPFVFFAHAGFYLPPARDGDGDSESESDFDWPTEAALESLISNGYISSSVQIAEGTTATNVRDPFGIYFYDDEQATLQHAFRATLQSQGISFSTTDSKGRGFAHAACGTEWESRLVAISLLFLLSIGADINLADKEGRTPLHGLVTWADRDLVEMLVSLGANPRAVDNDG